MNTLIMKNKEILKEFVSICEENDLWYSMDNLSLLSFFNGYILDENIEHFEVMMQYKDYEKLKYLYPQRVLDSMSHSEYFSPQNLFISANKKEYNLENNVFIKINLLIPSNQKNILNYLKFKNRKRAFMSHYLHYYDLKNFSNKFKSFLAKILKPSTKLINYKDIYEILYIQNAEGYIATEGLIKKKFS
ncbi:hypothetical protein [Mycoplasma struthionis]|uniref:Uncharacterized protein n=1 Tax=Mycoplasma struthionis TaxID=538220 RepID=A0A502M1T5_9MOLU|nr:hypothetical protein [Mycoplasma struthionis]TPI01917.1 hypothetical protein FJM01_01485 [Mycoplasma struthionis]